MGRTRGDARNIIDGAGLTPAEQNRPVADRNKVGIVLAQSPAGDAPCRKGDTITIGVGILDVPPSTSQPPIN